MRVNMLELLNVATEMDLDKFGFFCKNCGTELIGEFYGFDYIENQRIQDWILYEDHDCPICGKALDKKGGYFIITYSSYHGTKEFLEELYGEQARMGSYGWDLVDKQSCIQFLSLEPLLGRMAKIREANENQSILSKVEALASACNISSSLKEQTPNIIQAKSDPEQLKKYILTLINLENGIYSLKQRLAKLYYQRLQNDRFAVQCVHNELGIMEKILRPWKDNYASCLKELEDFKYRKPAPVLLECPEEPVKPLLKTPGLFNKKKVLAENEELMAQYNTAMAAYNEAFAKYEKEKARLEQEAIDLLEKQYADQQAKTELAKLEISNQKAAAIKKFQEAAKHPSAATAIKTILDKEISEAEALLAKLYSTRNDLYAYDVIFDKYHDVVALSSFYEYLMSGRCSQLEGADGMYNLYESETRANLVIAQLDHIIQSLEDIKDNQYVMYSELQKINSSLNTMNRTMSKALESIQKIEVNTESMNNHLETISQNTEVIAYNTAATAYYAKLNTELTNALGYMVAFN